MSNKIKQIKSGHYENSVGLKKKYKIRKVVDDKMTTEAINVFQNFGLDRNYLFLKETVFWDTFKLDRCLNRFLGVA